MSIAKNPAYRLNNGTEMPAVGLGVFRSEPETTVAAVRTAIAEGYRLIDTAAAYGNEQQVGEGIRLSDIPREDIFVATKVWISDYGYDRTLRAFEESCSKLGFDTLDLYLIHWPVPSAFAATIESYKATMKLLADGRVRAIGVCNFTVDHLDRLIKETGHIPAVNQVELHPFFNQAELREADARHGILTQAWSPIGGVNRYGTKATKEGTVKDPLLHPAITRLAEKYAKTPAQVVLRWQIELGNAPIPKSVRPERIKENFDIFDFALTQDEVASITALDTSERGGWDPDDVSALNFQ